MTEKTQIMIEISQPRPSYVIELDSNKITQVQETAALPFPKATRSNGLTLLTYQLKLPDALQGIQTQQEIVLPIPAEHLGKLALLVQSLYVERLTQEFRFHSDIVHNAEFQLLVFEQASTTLQATTDYHQLIAQRLDNINNENVQWQQEQLQSHIDEIRQRAQSAYEGQGYFYWSPDGVEYNIHTYNQAWETGKQYMQSRLDMMREHRPMFQELAQLEKNERISSELYKKALKVFSDVTTDKGYFNLQYSEKLDQLRYNYEISDDAIEGWLTQNEALVQAIQTKFDHLNQAYQRYQELKEQLGMRADLAEQIAKLTALQMEMREAGTEG